MSATDAVLFERWQTNRDAEAFAQLVLRYSGMVYGTCRRVLRNDADAEDAAQECFIELMRACVDPSPTLGPWLHTLAVRRSLDRFKSARRRQQREIQHAAAPERAHAQPEVAELICLIDEAIAALPESLRIPVVGRFLENRTHVEVASSLGVAEATVRYRIDKAIEQIREFLKKGGVTVSTTAVAGAMGAQLAEAAPASMTAALAKLALGAALPKLAPAAGKAAMAKAMLQSRGGLLLAAWLLVATVASVAYFTASPAGFEYAPPVAVSHSETPASEAKPAAPSPAAHQSDRAEPAAAATLLPVAPEPPEAPPAAPQPPAPCSISGRVYDDTGQGIAEACVTATTWLSGYDHRSMRTWKALTDADGRYTISGILMAYYHDSPNGYAPFADVSVSAVGLGTDGKRVDPVRPGDEATDVNFRLSAGVNLLGRLLDRVGNPVADATVNCRSYRSVSGAGGLNYHICSTETDGTFIAGFRDEGIASVLAISAEHGECFFPNVEVGRPEVIDLQMTEPATLTVLATYEDGTPAAGVGISLNARYAPDGGSPDYTAHVDSSNAFEITSAYSRSGTTGADGAFTFNELPAVPDILIDVYNQPLEQIIIITSNNEQPPQPMKILTKDAGAIQPGEEKVWYCTLPGTGQVMTLEVRVLGTISGEPLFAGTLIRSTRTDSTRYVEPIPGLGGTPLGETPKVTLTTPGTYEVWPRYKNADREEDRATYGRVIAWRPGAIQKVDLLLPDPFALSVRVVDEASQPIPQAEVNVMGIMSGETDADGRYGWNGLAPGVEAWFTVSKEGYHQAESEHISGEAGATYAEETVVLRADEVARPG